MTNQVATFNAANLPSINLPADIAAKLAAQWQQAEQNVTFSYPVLKTKNGRFVLQDNGNDTTLEALTLDVFLVAIDPRIHYTFYAKKFDELKEGEQVQTKSCYPDPNEPYDAPIPVPFVQKKVSQRAVVMLAGDPSHKLYSWDIGYNSLRKTGNDRAHTANFSQLLPTLNQMCKMQPGLLPPMICVQLSIDSKPMGGGVAFSLYNAKTPGVFDVRFADAASLEVMMQALSDGTVENMMKVEYEYIPGKDNQQQATQSDTRPQNQQPAWAGSQPPVTLIQDEMGVL